MTKNIQNTQIELVGKKFNITSLILGSILIGLGVLAFIYSGKTEGMMSSAMIFLGIVSAIIALFLFIAKLKAEVYTKTNSPIVKRQIYFDSADFYNIKSIIENGQFDSIEKFKRVEEGNIQLYVIHSKDKKFAALQLFKYEPFDFIPQTEIMTVEF